MAAGVGREHVQRAALGVGEQGAEPGDVSDAHGHARRDGLVPERVAGSMAVGVAASSAASIIAASAGGAGEGSYRRHGINGRELAGWKFPTE